MKLEPFSVFTRSGWEDWHDFQHVFFSHRSEAPVIRAEEKIKLHLGASADDV